MIDTHDLDILFPEVGKKTKFTAADGKRYEITFFIPAGVSLLTDIEDETDKTGIKRQARVLECFLKRQHSHMDIEWIKENLPFQFQNAIYLKIVRELQKSNKMLGEDAEAAMP